jgi:hypothetical protein
MADLRPDSLLKVLSKGGRSLAFIHSIGHRGSVYVHLRLPQLILNPVLNLPEFLHIRHVLVFFCAATLGQYRTGESGCVQGPHAFDLVNVSHTLMGL